MVFESSLARIKMSLPSMAHDMYVGAALLCSLLLMLAGAPKWRLAELVRASLRDLGPHFKAKIARFLAVLGPFARPLCILCPQPMQFGEFFGVPDNFPFRHIVTSPQIFVVSSYLCQFE